MFAWLQLFRLALAPTILWDVCAGAILASNGEIDRIPLLRLLSTILVLLLSFHGGMVLNDWADRGIDMQARRQRPLIDGRISPQRALLVGFAALATALLLTAIMIPARVQWIGVLLAMILVYDLGGTMIRKGAGPLLLALCRSLSLCMGMMVVLAPDKLVRGPTLWATVAYALYVLFLSRLATREEEGGPGMRMLTYLGAAALAPLPLFREASGQIPLAVVWLIFVIWLLRPAIRDRHIWWPPERVQAAVGHALRGLPLVPAMAILASGIQPLWALGGLLATGLTSLMARRLFPA
jgi:4-hydroxybenzoate polyprenyltransferase